MKIGKLEYALKFIQWCVPFWFYAFVVKSDLDFGWQWKIYTITVLAIAGVYTIIHYKVDLNKIYGYEVYLIFSIITQLT